MDEKLSELESVWQQCSQYQSCSKVKVQILLLFAKGVFKEENQHFYEQGEKQQTAMRLLHKVTFRKKGDDLSLGFSD